MTLQLQPLQANGPLAQLPLLRLEHAGPLLHVRLNRPAKRNSISDELLAQLHTVFVNVPKDTRCIVLSGEGPHFCAGLDLSEVTEQRFLSAWPRLKSTTGMPVDWQRAARSRMSPTTL